MTSEEPMVRLSAVVKNSALIAAAISCMSLGSFLLGGIVIVYPLMAILVLVATPFFWWMGRLIEKGRR